MTWKPIKYKDVKDIYEINEDGVIRNKFTQKVIKPHMGKNGYLQIKLARKEKKAPIPVHILVDHTFLDYDKNIKNPEVSHIIPDPYNNSVSNLEIVSKEDNIRHAVINNLYEKLENRYNASLTNKEVHLICQMLEKGVPYKKIRETIGPKLSKDVLKKIKSGENYRDISKHYDFSEATPFKYSDRIRKEIRRLIESGVTNVNDILKSLNLEKNSSTINLVKNQRRQVKKGSTTIESPIVINIDL